MFLFPACLLTLPDLGERVFQILAAAGGVCFLLEGWRSGDRKAIALLSLLTLGFFFVVLVSASGALDDATVIRRLEKSLYFLAAPFMAFLFRRLNIQPGFILASVKLTTIFIFLVALVQYQLTAERAGGEINALVFGYLALLLGFFSLADYPLESGAARIGSLLAWCAGCGAALLSQSRGVWVSALVLLPVLVWYWLNAGLLCKRVVMQVGGAFLIVLMLACTTPFVQQRATLAAEQYQSCVQEQACRNSVGLRLLMWESGLRAALQRPLLGWGLRHSQEAAAARLDDPQIRQSVLGFTHLHNEYINTLVAKGVIGLFSLLLLLFVPLIVFRKHASRRRLLTVNVIGLLLCTGYALAGISNLAFGHEIMNAFFIYYLALTLPAAQSKDWMEGVDSAGKLTGDILRAPSRSL